MEPIGLWAAALLVLLPFSVQELASGRGALRAEGLLCEHQREPLGIASGRPRLSWLLGTGQGREVAGGDFQLGYRVQVASSMEGLLSGQADLWDSGRVASGQTVDVPYGGEVLGSAQEAFWRVQVFDRGGAGEWSAPARFSTGLLEPEEWVGEWIGFDGVTGLAGAEAVWGAARWIAFPGGAVESAAGRCRFEREFTVSTDVSAARLRVTADDRYEVFLDGQLLLAGEPFPQADAWRRPGEIELPGALRAGVHRLSVRAANDKPGPAGLLLALTGRGADGAAWALYSDSQWSVVREGVRGEGESGQGGNSGGGSPPSDRNDRSSGSGDQTSPAEAPEAAVELGAYGQGPWGRFEQRLRLPPVRYLRRGFQLDQAPRRAMLFATALGVVDLELNGKPVGDARLVPGWSDYKKRVYARAFDVTEQLQAGDNALALRLADGWYSGYVGYGGQRDHYGPSPRAQVVLRIEFAAGEPLTLVSDGSWKAATGGLLEADLLMGERFDAGLEPVGWTSADFDDSNWSPVVLGAPLDPRIEPHPAPPMRAVAEFEPRSAWKVAPGTFVFDLGQNIAGVVRLAGNAHAGQVFTLRHAERLTPERQLYTQNLRGARATDVFIAGQAGPFVFEPRFTFHGFQYVEVAGLDPELEKPPAGLVTGVAWTSDIKYGLEIQCSDPSIERLAENIAWTQRMNFLDVPTDCPQRDERLGWTGDALIYGRTAAYFSDARAFFDKWLVDLSDAQRADGQLPMVAPLLVAGDDGGPAWADVGAILPWELYELYGDREQLARQYPSMRRFLDFSFGRCRENLVPPAEFHCFGDWVNLDAETPKEVIFSAFLARSAYCVAAARAALDGAPAWPAEGASGAGGELTLLAERWQAARRAFQAQWVDEAGHVHGRTQCAYALALAFGLLDEPQRTLAAGHLAADIEQRGGHFSTGFVGTRVLLQALEVSGQHDLAAALVLGRDYPSWLYAVDQGATSIWERWDGWTEQRGFQDPGMNSFAHYAFGCVGEWLVEHGAGLRLVGAQSGYGSPILLRPRPFAGLEQLSVRLKSIHGTIACGWRRLAPEAERYEYVLEVPANSRAHLEVPSNARLELDGVPVELVADSAGRLSCKHPRLVFQRVTEPAELAPVTQHLFTLSPGRYTLGVQL